MHNRETRRTLTSIFIFFLFLITLCINAKNILIPISLRLLYQDPTSLDFKTFRKIKIRTLNFQNCLLQFAQVKLSGKKKTGILLIKHSK